ncbi:MAG: hypothetical protein ABEJ43_00615 [Haloferacaceae archaeon]
MSGGDTVAPAEAQDEPDADGWVDPGLAEGRSRLLLFGGMGGLAIGTFLDVAALFWLGVAGVGVAFALNTAGKLVHYGRLAIPRRGRIGLSASWLALALTVVALLSNYAYARYGPGEGSFFWALAVGALGFALLHMAAQSTYLPATEHED